MSFWGYAALAGANIIGGLTGARATEKANEQNAALQREFAQHGISWKVADAKRAGLHPLAALGTQTASASPSYVGADPYQGISGIKQDALSLYMQKQVIEGNELDNKIKGAQANLLNAQTTGEYQRQLFEADKFNRSGNPRDLYMPVRDLNGNVIEYWPDPELWQLEGMIPFAGATRGLKASDGFRMKDLIP